MTVDRSDALRGNLGWPSGFFVRFDVCAKRGNDTVNLTSTKFDQYKIRPAQNVTGTIMSIRSKRSTPAMQLIQLIAIAAIGFSSI
jgi:hypothetical protein